jgi:glutamate racemase
MFFYKGIVMIKLPQGKIKLSQLKQWDSHSQNEFNKLDKRTLDYVIMYCKHYLAIMTKLKQLHPKTLEILAYLDKKCNESYRFNNYNRDKNT